MSENNELGRVRSEPGSYPTGHAADGVDGAPRLDPSRGREPHAFFEEEDNLGGVIGFMCLTDFEYELGCAAGGNRVYSSAEDLRLSRKCVAGCGIAEVRVTGIRVVQESAEDERIRDSDGCGEAGETPKSGSTEGDSAGPSGHRPNGGPNVQ